MPPGVERKSIVHWILRSGCQPVRRAFVKQLQPVPVGKSRFGVPKGIRTPVIAVKGRCPRPG